MAWTNPIDYSVGDNTCVARFDEQILANIDFAGSHTHSGSAGDGANAFVGGSTLSGNNSTQVVSKYITFPFMALCASPTLGGTQAGGASFIANGGLTFANASAQDIPPSAIYLLDLDKGTWEFSFYHAQAATGGILGACVDGASLGQRDITGTASNNVLSPASSITLSSSGTKQVRLATRAAGSGGGGANNFVRVHSFEFRRTGS